MPLADEQSCTLPVLLGPPGALPSAPAFLFPCHSQPEGLQQLGERELVVSRHLGSLEWPSRPTGTPGPSGAARAWPSCCWFSPGASGGPERSGGWPEGQPLPSLPQPSPGGSGPSEASQVAEPCCGHCTFLPGAPGHPLTLEGEHAVLSYCENTGTRKEEEKAGLIPGAGPAPAWAWAGSPRAATGMGPGEPRAGGCGPLPAPCASGQGFIPRAGLLTLLHCRPGVPPSQRDILGKGELGLWSSCVAPGLSGPPASTPVQEDCLHDHHARLQEAQRKLGAGVSWCPERSGSPDCLCVGPQAGDGADGCCAAGGGALVLGGGGLFQGWGSREASSVSFGSCCGVRRPGTWQEGRWRTGRLGGPLTSPGGAPGAGGWQ